MKKPGMDEAAIRELAIEVHKEIFHPSFLHLFRPAGLPLGIKVIAL